MTPKDRFRTLWPLPGGAGAYLDTLNWILEITQKQCQTHAIEKKVSEHFRLTGLKTTHSYLRVIHSLGLIEIVGETIYPTPEGQKYLHSQNPNLIYDSLIQRIEGCDLLLETLRERPLRISVILERLNAEGNYSWATQAQVRYRLRWLEEVGAICRIGKGRPEYGLTGNTFK